MSKKKIDPLVGDPLTTEEQEYYAAWAERAEAGDFHPAPAGDAYEGEEAQREARELLESIVGAEELDVAIGRGRPPLEGPAGRGASPKRQVRLPRELDAALAAQAEAEHRRPSAIIRDALSDYLSRKAS